MEQEIEQAVGIVRRLEAIASREMLVRGAYIEEGAALRPDLVDAPCGGRRACMVGSFFLAAGLGVQGIHKWIFRRDEVAAIVPGMALARAALNRAARTHPAFTEDLARDSVGETQSTDEMEDLFEHADVPRGGLHALVLSVTQAALEDLHA